MSEFIPKAGAVKVGGLGRKAQKLQALKDKAAAASGGGSGARPGKDAGAGNLKAVNSFAGKKTSFQRKAV